MIHYLELLRDVVGFDELKKKVVNPLKGRKIAAYYGCLLLRPSKELGFDNPENPSIMEDFIRALGAEPAIYAYRNECCGGYVTLENNGLAQKKCNAIMAVSYSHLDVYKRQQIGRFLQPALDLNPQAAPRPVVQRIKIVPPAQVHRLRNDRLNRRGCRLCACGFIFRLS